MEVWREWVKTGGGRVARWLEVASNGVRQGCVRVPAGVCVMVGQKKKRLLGNKQGQRHEVRVQRRDVPEGRAANVATLRSNFATFQRWSKSNVATLGSNVVTFQKSYNPTS